jgi:polygalacturonase
MSEPRILHIPAAEAENSAAIQALIDQGLEGPVRVVLEPGVHRSAGLQLRSNVELHLSEGAELHFVPDYEAYAHCRVDIIAEQSDRAMIIAKNCAHIALTGDGRIVCGGQYFSVGHDEEMGVHIPAALRPRVLMLDQCDHVRVAGLTITESPMWTLHFAECTNLTLSDLQIDNDKKMPNTDGIVIDSCRDVSLSNLTISTADDGIVLKTSARADGQPSGTCERVRAVDCTITSLSCALKLGTESYANFCDIEFKNCRILGSNRGLGIFSRDGGAVENIRFEGIELHCAETPNGYWGSGEAVTINVVDRRPEERPAGRVSGVVINQISGAMEGAINIHGERPGDVSDINLTHVHLTQKPGPLGTGLSYDLRPTPADLIPSEENNGRLNSWRKDEAGNIMGVYPYPGGMPGLFAHNVIGLEMVDVIFNRPSTLPASFNGEDIVITTDPALRQNAQ